MPRGWLFPLAGTVVILVAASGEVVSRAILLDFVAWWPVWAAIGLLAFLARDRRVGRIRVSGLIPLVAVACLGVFGYAYFAGWAVMPSASLQLIGPGAETAQVAAMSARIGGRLEIEGTGTGFLYQARPLRGGGPIGAPDAVEQTQGQAFSVALQPRADPGLYTFSGWSVVLSTTTSWGLTLQGDQIIGDLSTLTVDEVHLIGAGRVKLGTPSGMTPVTVDGPFRIEIQPDAPVRVIGDASVPDGWEQTEDGWVSPAAGDGWLISGGDATSLVITDH